MEILFELLVTGIFGAIGIKAVLWTLASHRSGVAVDPYGETYSEQTDPKKFGWAVTKGLIVSVACLTAAAFGIVQIFL